MPNLLDHLAQDHIRMHAVLAALPDAVHQALTGSPVAVDRLFCLLDYVEGYPDQVHHPLEDLLLDEILELELSEAEHALVLGNLKLHAHLHSATQGLLEQFENLDDTLIAETETYIAQQLEHMHYEDRHIFPLAHRLSAEQWQRIGRREALVKDALFVAAEARFLSLHEWLGLGSELPVQVAARTGMKYIEAAG